MHLALNVISILRLFFVLSVFLGEGTVFKDIFGLFNVEDLPVCNITKQGIFQFITILSCSG